jgi:hypothetical protein
MLKNLYNLSVGEAMYADVVPVGLEEEASVGHILVLHEELVCLVEVRPLGILRLRVEWSAFATIVLIVAVRQQSLEK